MIEPGAQFGHYEVLSAIGAGGMGEVYRARDMRLKRDVALKILPLTLASDPDRLARFQREAEVLASLNHPHIATIHGVEQSGDTRALVLELVEGDTLADRIARGPIPLDDALAIATQIADALEAAHQQGVIHRDLKPANIKVTADNVVKVLDFGLATVVSEAPNSAADATYSPTLTLAATRAGIILGTAAYMSPEQASGKPVDKRSDVWSFGVVLWEMLTGRRLFDGETISHTLAFVLTKDPDWTALPPNTPPSIARLVRRCLERDRRRRLPDIGSARLELDDTLSAPPGVPSAVTPPAKTSRWRPALPWAIAAVLAVALIAYTTRRPEEARVDPLHLTIDLGADVSMTVTGAPSANLALSPDGTVLAFVAQPDKGDSEIYLRRLDRLEATPLSNTTNARNPFFSPDGQSIGFFADGKLKTVSVNGGAAIPLADAPAARGGWWSADGTIVFTSTGAPNASLMKVPAQGGTAEPLIPLHDGESTQRFAQVLPGGKAVIYTSSATAGAFDDSDIVAYALPNGPRTVLRRGGYFGRYVSSGHLLYIHRGTLFAVPFDVTRLIADGQATPIAEGISASTGTGAVQLAVSDTGRLVYQTGLAGSTDVPISWRDSRGNVTPLREVASDWSNPAFSPDGTRLAVDNIPPGGPSDIMVLDWVRNTFSRLTFDATLDVKPVWTNDSRRIAFASSRGEERIPNLYVMSANGTDDAKRLTQSKVTQLPSSFHPDDNLLAYQQQNPGGWDVYLLPLEGDDTTGWKAGTPRAFLNASYTETEAMFSRDGRWVAYQSTESGTTEIYVRPFEGNGKRQISSGGGTYPMWSRTRDELFYQSPSGQIMAVSFRIVGDAFEPGNIRELPGPPYNVRPRLRSVNVHPDGNRFAMASRPASVGAANTIVLRPNFADELRRLAPATR